MACGWSTVTTEDTNFARLCKLLIDGGTQVLRDIFDAVHPPCDLKKHLMDRANHRILKNLKTKGILRPEQWNKLYPGVGIPSSASFDITLLSLLLRNVCKLPKPVNGWSDEPLPTSIKQEDDIVRIKLYRNKLYGHISKPSLSDADFTKYWSDIETVLVRLGGAPYEVALNDFRLQSFDPEDEKYYIQCLKEWAENDEKIMRKLEALMENVDEIKNMMEQVLNRPERTAAEILEDAELYSQKLRHSIIQQTERHQKGAISSDTLQSAKTDDIFTNLTVHHSKQSHLQQKDAETDEHAHKTLSEIRKCTDIFVDEKEEENPKTILVAGNPGIGKTLFSHKIARDWAKDYISIPNVRITYLLTLRNLNFLGEELMNLEDLLNLSSLSNETTMTNATVIDYIVEHPKELFVILDGMDEYKYRHKITSDYESRFPNDVKTKIPVPALISKLLHKKILRESITMVTSRTGEANKMDEKIHFHRYVKIGGFSESQILEYVENYFASKTEEEKSLAIKKVKETKHYMTFGRVPYMCMLMCVVLEWEISNNITSDKSVSLTLTEFYSQVIQCIENNYNKAICSLDEDRASAVKKTLDNLSLLAAQLFEQSKFSFTLQDLEKLKLTEQQLTHLKVSNLLCCNPVARNSPFQKTTCEFSFNHFTLQEFFVARYFVSVNKIPAQKMTEMILTFMSGLMDADKNEELMLELLECIPKQEEGEYTQVRVSMRCLVEYKLSDSFLTRVLSEDHRGKYWDRVGFIRLYNISDCYCGPLAMFVDKLSDISHTLTKPPHVLVIADSQLSCTGLCTLLPSLTNPQTTITELLLYCCNLDDKCAEYLCQILPNTKIIRLDLDGNDLTDKGIQYIVNSHDCLSKLTHLHLSGNKRVSDECKKTAEQYLSHNYPNLSLYML